MVVLPAIFISRFGPFLRRPRSTGIRPGTDSPAASTARPVPATGRSTRRSIPRPWAGATRPTSSTAAPGRTAFRKGAEVDRLRDGSRDHAALDRAIRCETVPNSSAKCRAHARRSLPLLAIDGRRRKTRQARAPRPIASGTASRCRRATRAGSRPRSRPRTTPAPTAGRRRCGSISCRDIAAPE